MRRLVAVLTISAAVLVLHTGGALAEVSDPSKNTVTVPTTRSGQTISEGTAGFDPNGTQATASSRTDAPQSGGLSGGVPPDSSLVIRQIPFNQVPSGAIVNSSGVIVNNPLGTQQACPAGQTGFFVSDPNGNGVRTVCVPNQAAPPPQATTAFPLQLAQEASARQPWPDLRVATNPDTGMTGLPSWFWCVGSPSMPDATATSGPLTVTVRATFADVVWDFGDASRSSGGFGQPFPAPSDVQHVYQTDSFGLSGGYTVTAFVRWRVSFSVNGGPFTDIGFKVRDYSRPYVVEQLQPQAVDVR